jgi:hypothetical protein
MLRGGSKRSHDFEDAVGLLLHMCGCRVTVYGETSLFRDAPDLLAFCDNHRTVLVVECTLREIDAKLSKLHRRSREIAAALPAYRVVPAVFTPLPREAIADHQRATDAGIVVASEETIGQLMELAEDGAPIARVLRHLGVETV